jgi:electron transfer flavoprotein beta subunit
VLEPATPGGSAPRRVVVVLATIADPKWLLSTGALTPDHKAPPRTLSPFDEAALEVGLKLRDRAPNDVEVSALIIGGREFEPIVRAVAALCPRRTVRLDLPTDAMWDARSTAFQIKTAIAGLGDFDLVLLGREFGDFDDGAIPPFLASIMGLPFIGLVQRATFEAQGVKLIRDRAGLEEQASFSSPVVASVTNDKSNRLRRPLLKAVMMAKQEPLVVLPPQDAVQLHLRYEGMAAVEETRRAGDCRFLVGSPEAQAAELAELLLRWKGAA